MEFVYGHLQSITLKRTEFMSRSHMSLIEEDLREQRRASAMHVLSA